MMKRECARLPRGGPDGGHRLGRALDDARRAGGRLPQSKGYDCVIPVGGGKDSFYQTHLAVKKLGLRPLLVTYHGNNFLPEASIISS
ncbi:MAG: hypothetical protein JKP95_03365 [Oceanicaulis sp.]|nr:hypothetical protein [Oceanicaulis sp.]